jgi:hypothetical protein
MLSPPPSRKLTPGLIRSTFLRILAEGWFPAGDGFSSMVKLIADTIYVHGSAPAVAIMDAASIMHVGCTANDQSLVLEARKRCVFAVNGLRLEANRSRPEMAVSGVLILVLGIFANQVLCCSLIPCQRNPSARHLLASLTVADSLSRCTRLFRTARTHYSRSPAHQPLYLHAVVTNGTRL